MKAYPPKMRYRLHAGYIAWLLQRISGLALVLYLVMHIYVIHNIARGREAFNEIMGIVQSPMFHLAEAALLGAVVYHGINGIRVILLDYGSAADKEKIKPWVLGAMAVSAVLIVAGGIPMLKLALQH